MLNVEFWMRNWMLYCNACGLPKVASSPLGRVSNSATSCDLLFFPKQMFMSEFWLCLLTLEGGYLLHVPINADFSILRIRRIIFVKRYRSCRLTKWIVFRKPAFKWFLPARRQLIHFLFDRFGNNLKHEEPDHNWNREFDSAESLLINDCFFTGQSPQVLYAACCKKLWHNSCGGHSYKESEKISKEIIVQVRNKLLSEFAFHRDCV